MLSTATMPAIETSPQRKRRVLVKRMSKRVRSQLPFPADYNRSDTAAYEAYRSQAISVLREQGCSTALAYCIVDDCIGLIEA